MTFWSPQEIADGLAQVECVLFILFKNDTLYVVMDTRIEGYDPARSEFSVVTGTLVYKRANDVLRALASLWTCGPLPCEIELIPQNFTLPVVGGRCLYSRISQP